MNKVGVQFLPVINRELRASARHAFTYYLRTLGAGALLLASLFFGLENGFESNFGGKLFGYLHFTMFYAIWLLVPLLAADCISRERREGTLGLLFMTGLGGSDIVVAKSAAQGLRALTLWLAVAPVLAMPFLLGGVSWQEAMLSLAINSSAMCWALAAGVLGSAWSKTWGRAVLRASIFALFFLVLMSLTEGWSLTSLLRAGRASPWVSNGLRHLSSFNLNLDYTFLLGIGFITNLSRGLAIVIFRTITNGQLAWLATVSFAISLLGLALSIHLAGVKTRRIWQEPPPSRQQIWLHKTFCTPVFWLSLFHSWMKRKLDANPIGWLEQRTWSGRLITWGWLAVVISLYSVVLSDPGFFQRSSAPQNIMGWLLLLSLAISTAASFRRERESGVLELLLVSPIGERTIISGRLRGLWGQFLPAFGLLLLVWLYLATISLTREAAVGPIIFYAATFLSLPVTGLYFSLRCRAFIAALLGALGTSIIVPVVIGTIIALWWVTILPKTFLPGPAYSLSVTGISWVVAIVQICIALFCWKRLRSRLQTRSFPLDRPIA
jgi:ABC-type transport system involved in multi-copper enzyme maturation permease subunit